MRTSRDFTRRFGATLAVLGFLAAPPLAAQGKADSVGVPLSDTAVASVADTAMRAPPLFGVARLDTADLRVPAVDAASALQGKVAGATVYRGSGRPGFAPSVLLRGATSINAAGRSQDPLYIVDGVVLGSDLFDVDSGSGIGRGVPSASLADIGGADIETVEVLPGAAAAAMYGARGANGVVRITTKRGTGLPAGQVRYTVRSEYGSSSLGEADIVPTSHFWRMNASETAFVFVNRQDEEEECAFLECLRLEYAGQGLSGVGPDTVANEWNSYMTNPWPTTYDVVGQVFPGGDHLESYVSASGRSGATNFHVSFSHLEQKGVMIGMDGFRRNNFRLNLDQSVSDKIRLSASVLYSASDQDQFPEGSENPLFRLTRTVSGVNLRSCVGSLRRECTDDPQDLVVTTHPFNASEAANPIYELLLREFTEDRSRFLGSVTARWSPAGWLALDGHASHDRLDRQREDFYPPGYVFSAFGGPAGMLFEQNHRGETLAASAGATTTVHLTEQITNRTRIRYLREREDRSSSSKSGYGFTVEDLRTFDNVQANTLTAGSSSQSIRSDGFLLSTTFDIADRYTIDAAIRNDGSSLFGKNQRRHWYHRLAGAWRLGSESWFDLPGVDELKIRAAYGTAGNRPPFAAQYETVELTSEIGAFSREVFSGITGITFANPDLKPERSAETEVGLDASLLDGHVGFGFTYGRTETFDQILKVPLPAFIGFQSQYRNAGTLESRTIEASLDAVLYETHDMSWSARLLYDRTRSEITELDAPAFTYGPPGQNLGNIFYAREGEALGTFYGALVATECGHLPEGTDCSLFSRNDEGLFVYSAAGETWGDTYTLPDGTTVNWGTPIRGECIDPQREDDPLTSTDERRTEFCPVGSAVPDYRISLASTFTWGGFQLYGLIDSEQGFDIYNQASQSAVFRSNSAVCDQTGIPIEEAKPIGYCRGKYFGVGGLQPSTLFAEDGSYIKLRELSIRYTFDADQLSRWPGLHAFSDLTMSLTGRNLFTWTGYSGYDPETGKAGGDTGSAALARVDAYTYPNFRTWTLGLEVGF